VYISIGQRIAITRRRRGMSQAQVAGPLGKSVQWLSNIERGVRSADRYSILVPIADVLSVSVAELTGSGPVAPELPDVEHDTARTVRLALSDVGFADAAAGPNGSGSSALANLEELGRRVRAAWALVHEARYRDLGELVPGLVRECERAARAGGGERRAWRLLAELYQAIAAMMAKLGEVDAAWVAADRSTFAATESGDVVLAAAGGFRLGHAFLNAGKLHEAARAVDLAAAAVEAVAQAGDTDATALWGALNLVRAIAAARSRDRDAAVAAIARAEDATERLGPAYVDRRFDTEFGRRNVALHAVAVAVELGDPAEAVRRAADLDTVGLSAERRARLLVDLARAHVQRRRAGAAVKALEHAERLAPEMVRRHWLARETVRELLRRERGRAKPGRLDLAGRMGLV
jgi:transcriptional regulator with XRE-family HTH domain